MAWGLVGKAGRGPGSRGAGCLECLFLRLQVDVGVTVGGGVFEGRRVRM